MQVHGYFTHITKWILAIFVCRHPNVDSVRVIVFSSKSTEDGRVSFCTVLVNGFRGAALQCEVAVCRLYECVLAQAVEGVLEAVQRPDMWVTEEPTCIKQTNVKMKSK